MDIKNCTYFTLRQNQERVRNIKKGGDIIIVIFISSFIYSLKFILKYCDNPLFQSIILSIIISSIFTCIIGYLMGKYLIRKSKTKLQKEFNN